MDFYVKSKIKLIMNLLNREALLKKEVLKIEKVSFEDDSFVCVRQMTGRERDLFEKSLMVQVRKGNKIDYETRLDDFRAKLAVCTLCDEEGVLLLKPNDVPTLSQNMSASRLEKIITAAQALNKITEEDKEDIVKNSGGDPIEDSSSD